VCRPSPINSYETQTPCRHWAYPNHLAAATSSYDQRPASAAQLPAVKRSFADLMDHGCLSGARTIRRVA
jgi:hypothetical protein